MSSLQYVVDVIDLRNFYRSGAGQMVRAQLSRKLKPKLNLASGQVFLGLGYALPYLDELTPGGVTALAFMMARQGCTQWPPEGDVRAALVDDYDLPLLESVADTVLVTHGLERAEDPGEMLQEIWRVLAPQGRLLLVVPNRRGLWAASEKTPFGYGQPFSRSQLQHLLKEARFSVIGWDQALVAPPFSHPSLIRMAAGLDGTLNRVFGRFSGVTIVEAAKQVYAFSSGKRTRRLVPRLRPVLLPSPRPASRTKHE